MLALLGKVALRKIVQTTTGEAILGGNVILRQAVEAKADEVWGMGWVHRVELLAYASEVDSRHKKPLGLGVDASSVGAPQSMRPTKCNKPGFPK